MTDHQEAERRLRQAQKMEAIGQLTGGLAHDFNNILGVVIGNLDLLTDRFAAGSDEQELLGAALQSAQRGADLTRQLLAFARRQPLAPRLVDLGATLTSTAALLRRTLGENVVLSLTVAEGLWPVLVDAALLESAILNLAVNARDAMPDGGQLTIETENTTVGVPDADVNPEGTVGDYVVIAVSDNGIGMAPDVLARVFEPFFTTKDGKGTGLGLSMVHGFVKQSGGHTTIYSEPGRGTTIRIYLPRTPTTETPKPAETAAMPIPGGNEVILVVEDNSAMRAIVMRQLAALGYRAIPTEGPAAALAIIDGREAIDLLFTDVVMPGGMDGRGLAAAARARRPHLKVLFTSGFTPTAARSTMLDGAFDLLSKPYRFEDLARSVRAAIDRPS